MLDIECPGAAGQTTQEVDAGPKIAIEDAREESNEALHHLLHLMVMLFFSLGKSPWRPYLNC